MRTYQRCAFFPLYGGTASTPFDEKIGPLLKARCAECHSEGKKTSGLSIATLESVTAGGSKHGRAILEGVPGTGNSSTPRIEIPEPRIAAESLEVQFAATYCGLTYGCTTSRTILFGTSRESAHE